MYYFICIISGPLCERERSTKHIQCYIETGGVLFDMNTFSSILYDRDCRHSPRIWVQRISFVLAELLYHLTKHVRTKFLRLKGHARIFMT